jgi:fructose-bisphosphate aldolase class II
MESLREVLVKADRERIAIGHFNFSELAAFNAIVAAAQELRVPAMVGVSEGERAYVGVAQAAALVRSVRESYGLPIFLNADHTHSIEKAEQAARAGFDEIIFDGSATPLAENIADTTKAVEAIKSINPAILVEGEIGYIGASSEILEQAPQGMTLSTPEEARQFVTATRVDVLAPAVGNMHGLLTSMVRGEAAKRLDLARIAAIKDAVRIPMTLHGGSGTDDGDFRKAIKAGMTIVHVNTELRLAWRRGLESSLQAHPHEVAPYKILPAVVDEIRRVVDARLRLFNER